MSKETIFISYSRDNTKFVMNLAKNLRKAGANIWLDQLDIKAGENWDNAIQKALQESGTFLIVLSESSVASNNVMDEVGYALGAEKKVIPVLIEQCKIPFRLERRQFVDFTGNDQKGIDNLIEALDLENDVAEKLSDEANRNSLAAESDLEEIKEMREADKAKKQQEIKADKKAADKVIEKSAEPIKMQPKTNQVEAKKSKLPIYILIGAILTIGAIGFAFKDKLFPNQDLKAWESANIGNNIQIYEKYIKDHPKGDYVSFAKDSIRSKSDVIIAKEDEDSWKVALNANTEVAYELYRNNHPNGIHTSKVDNMIAKLKNSAADNAEWSRALASKSVDGYINYMTNPLEGKSKLNEAVAELKSLGKSGWLYAGRTDDTIVTSDAMFKYHWRKNGGEVTSNAKPVEGDIVVMTQQSRSTRRSLANAVAKSGSTRAWVKNKKAYVVSSTKEGTALFLEVIF